MNRLATIRLHRLEVPLRTPYKLAFGPVRHFDTLLVEAEDSHGRAGLGEATVLTGYTEETVAGSWSLMQQFAAGAVGDDAERAREKLLARVDEAPFTITALVTAIELMRSDAVFTVPAVAPVPLLGR